MTRNPEGATVDTLDTLTCTHPHSSEQKGLSIQLGESLGVCKSPFLESWTSSFTTRTPSSESRTCEQGLPGTTMQPCSWQPGRRSTQGCWTCKARKIGCDKTIPTCINCRRSNRHCLGYGIRLAWPDQADGRRASVRHAVTFLAPSSVSAARVASYGTHFLNLTYADFHARDHPAGVLLGLHTLIRKLKPHRPLCFFPDLHERESHLLHYYTDRLSGMVSTIDVNNGFRDVLLPMALAAPSMTASSGLRHAVFALAAFHLWGSSNALPYRVKAIRALSSSLAVPRRGVVEAQMAASMMLCVYNVFDETEGDWEIHLRGAAQMLQQLVPSQVTQSRQHFLCAWLLYHEVLGAFSQPHKQCTTSSFVLSSLRALGVDLSLVVGSLGCSIETMEALDYANKLRSLQLSGELAQLGPEAHGVRPKEWDQVFQKVSLLRQNLEPHAAASLPPARRAQVLATAELYRLAVLIYLVNISPLQPLPDPPVTAYLDHAFVILDSLETCTSPWPLFVIACEASSDDQRRVAVLHALDGMDERRGIGNVFVLRRIIESFWKQKDLRAGGGGGGGGGGSAAAAAETTRLRWWDVVDLETASPWFV
ncbi:fungal specific transcription factor domain-containing protein [Microdochium nivale]|nr:fungal specific transcription factor domain-containing protein [Microdochium nivale]